MQNYLNVVFHGTFAFVDRGTTVAAIVPSVMSHVYKAGTWLHETDLRAGTTYTLQGVSAADKAPDLADLGMPVLSGKRSIRANSNQVFCSIVLPPPVQFVGRRCFSPRNGETVFEGSDGTLATRQMTSYAETHVLIYPCPNADQVSLAKLNWKPPANQAIVNLHIFAEPGSPMDMPGNSHIINSFATLMQVMHGNLAIRKTVENGGFILTDCPNSQPVPGLPAQEEEGLVERRAFKGVDTNPAACASGGATGDTGS